MILACVIIGALTAITVASLAMVSAINGREHEAEERDARAEQRAANPPTIYPWRETFLNTDTRCPVCGALNEARTWGHGVGFAWTLDRPASCDNDSCAAYPNGHSHMSCNSCGKIWFMAPAEAT